MTSELIVLMIGCAVGFQMAWDIGANDVANSMASALWARFATRRFLLVSATHSIVGAMIAR